MTDPTSTPASSSDPFQAGADALRAGTKVIDLREAATTRVRVSRDQNPFSHLSKQERMRLIVRVLCEIVAYGELEDAGATAVDTGPTERPAVNG